jgi:hydroxypyruvate isomerase
MPTLKQSASEWCYFKDHYVPADYYRRIKDMGISGVEMVDPKRWKAARAAGLEVVNLVGPGMQRGLNHSEYHAEIVPGIKKAIAEARDNGIPTVIIFSGNRAGQADAKSLDNCIAGIRQVIADAEAAKINLWFEVLNKFDHADYNADNSPFAFTIARAINSPRFKILYDIYHMQRMGEKLADTIVANLDVIGHLHIAGSPKRNFPGKDQEIDYRPIVQKVLAAGYKGYWGQEFVPEGEPLEELGRASALFESYAASAGAKGKG